MATKKDDQVAKATATDSLKKEVKAKAENKEKSVVKAEAKPEGKKETKPAATVDAKPAAKSGAKAEIKPEVKPAANAESSKEAGVKPAKAKSSKKIRLKQKYDKEVIPYLVRQFKYKNINQAPRLEKIVINMGLGEDKDDSKRLQVALSELTMIAGQKAVLTKAKHSVANFKIRENMTVGAKVTLRGAKMYEFFDKFVSIVLPRVRDFRGVPLKSFDGRGNYAMGIKEQLVFPEILYDQVDRVRGFDICFVTTAKTDEEAKELLAALGMPFKAAGGING